MKTPQIILATIAVSLVLIPVIVISVFIYNWEQQQSVMYVFPLWMTLVAVVTIAILAHSTHVLRVDTILVTTFLGEVIRVDSTLNDSHGGFFGTGLIIAFPPGLIRVHELPTTAWELRYHTNNGFTAKVDSSQAHGTEEEPAIPVKVDTKFVFQLSDNLAGIKKLLQAFPSLSNTDLLTSTDIPYYESDPETYQTRTGTYQAPAIVKRIIDITQGPLDEAVFRAIAVFGWSDIRQNTATIEDAILEQCAMGTVFETSGLLDHENPVMRFRGLACASTDLNVATIVPESREVTDAMSARLAAKFNAVAAKETGQGEGQRFRKVMDITGASADRILALEATKNIDAVTVVAASGVLDAIAGTLLGQTNKPLTSTSPPPTPATPTPPTTPT